MWKDLYVGPGSIYVNGQKVLQTDPSQNVLVSADTNQSLVLQTTGTGDVELNPTGSGVIYLKSNILLSGGKTFNTSDNSTALFPFGVAPGNLSLSGNSIAATNLNGGISITPSGSGGAYFTSGNVGVGTTNPQAKLDIQGTASSSGLVVSGLSGLMKSNGASGVAAAAAGVDYESPLAFGFPLTRSVNTIGWSGLTTSTAATVGNIPYFSGANTFANVATSSLALSSALSYSGTLGSLVGGTGGNLSIAANGLSLGNLPQIAANSVLGNSTGSPGNVGAIATSSLFQTASASVSGLLSSADWTTFTGKLASVTADAPLSGSGTSGSHLTLDTSGTWSGNAASATKLATARAINGVSFDGTQNITITAASSTLLSDSNVFSGNTTFSNATTSFLFVKSAFSSPNATIGALTATSSLAVYGSASFGGTATSSFSTAGALTLAAPLALASGGTGTTTAPVSQLIYGSATSYQSVATTSLTASGVLSLSNPISVIGATASALSLTGGSNGQALAWNNGAPIWIATTTFSAGSGISLTLNGNSWSIGNTGVLSYDAWTHPAFGQSATTSLMLFNGAASSTQLSAVRAYFGGTATSTFDAGGIPSFPLTGLLQGKGAGTNVSAITDSSTVGQTLRVTGASTYAWGAFNLSNTNAVTNTLGISNGGTNASSFTTSGNAVYYTGSALATAPTTAAITIPYASTTALTASGSAYFATSGGMSASGRQPPMRLFKSTAWAPQARPPTASSSLMRASRTSCHSAR